MYRDEYSRFSVTPNMFHFRLIGERVLENLRRFEAEKSRRVSSKASLVPRTGLMADTGGVRDDNLVKDELLSPEGRVMHTENSKTLNRTTMEQRINLIGTAAARSFDDIQQEADTSAIQLSSLISGVPESFRTSGRKSQGTSLSESETFKSLLESLFTVTTTFSVLAGAKVGQELARVRHGAGRPGAGSSRRPGRAALRSSEQPRSPQCLRRNPNDRDGYSEHRPDTSIVGDTSRTPRVLGELQTRAAACAGR